jgi:hypothetical protein
MDSKFSDTSWGMVSQANQMVKLGVRPTPKPSGPLSTEELKEIKEFCVRLLGPDIVLYVKDKTGTSENDLCYVMIEVRRQVNDRVSMQDALARRLQTVFEGRKARIMLVDSQTKFTDELRRFRIISRQI